MNRSSPPNSFAVVAATYLLTTLAALTMGVSGCDRRDSKPGMKSLKAPATSATPDETTAAAKSPTVTLHTASGLIPIDVEVANTPETRRQGLMYRESLGERSGMVFVFEQSRDHQFWMENTLIPLDMIFITDDFRVAGIVHSATPKSRALRGVGKPSLYVLEVNGGAAKRWGLQAGDRVQFDAVF